MNPKLEKQVKEYLMLAALVGFTFSLFQVNQKLNSHLENCAAASRSLRNVAVAVFVIVSAQLLLNGLGFIHFTNAPPTVINQTQK